MMDTIVTFFGAWELLDSLTWYWKLLVLFGLWILIFSMNSISELLDHFMYHLNTENTKRKIGKVGDVRKFRREKFKENINILLIGGGVFTLVHFGSLALLSNMNLFIKYLPNWIFLIFTVFGFRSFVIQLTSLIRIIKFGYLGRVDDLIRLLSLGSSSSHILLRSLERVQVPAEKAIIEALNNESDDTRRANLLVGLLWLESDKETEFLINTLANHLADLENDRTLFMEQIISALLTEALTTSGDSQIIELLGALLTDPRYADHKTRMTILEAFEKLNDKRSVDWIIPMLFASQPVSDYATKLLNKFGENQLVNAAMDMITLPERIDARRITPSLNNAYRERLFPLAKLKNPRMVNLLIAAIKNNGWYYLLRNMSGGLNVTFEALALIGGTTVIEELTNLIDHAEELGLQAETLALATCCLAVVEGSSEPLASALFNKSLAVREYAVRSLAQLNTNKAVTILRNVVLENEKWSLRESALEALQEMKVSSAQDASTEIQDEWEHKKQQKRKQQERKQQGYEQLVSIGAPALADFKVEKMTMVHYTLMRFSNQELRILAEQARAQGGSYKIEVPRGRIVDITNGISVLWDKVQSMQEVAISTDLLNWAVTLTEIMDKATEIGTRVEGPLASSQVGHELLEHWKKAYELAPDYPLVLMSLGVAYSDCGRHETGLKYLEKAHRLAPTNQRIKNNLESVRSWMS